MEHPLAAAENSWEAVEASLLPHLLSTPKALQVESKGTQLSVQLCQGHCSLVK